VSPYRPVVPTFDLGLVADKLSGQIITMFPGEVMSSTAVKLSWEIRKNNRFIEGFHIRYRTILFVDQDDGGGSLGGRHGSAGGDQKRQTLDTSSSWIGSGDFSVETVQSSVATMYTLNSLEKNAWYEINVQPFYLSVIGQESNTVRVKTLEDGTCFIYIETTTYCLHNTQIL